MKAHGMKYTSIDVHADDHKIPAEITACEFVRHRNHLLFQRRLHPTI